MLLPNVIIIGAAKCGTSALWYNLNKHPEIHMATREDSLEMHFWKQKFWKKGFGWYSNKFEEGKINGEKTTSYWSTKESIPTIAQHMPDIKLILCIRNPVDRAHSDYSMMKRKNKSAAFNSSHYKKDGEYINHIKKNVLPYVNKKQLHICIMERMKSDTNAEMAKVFDFVGASPMELPQKEIDGHLLNNRTRAEDVDRSQNEDFFRTWTKSEKLKGPRRKALMKSYEPANKRLFKFLGYEIEEWKA